MNSFLSTTTNKNVALQFISDDPLFTDNLCSVLFEFKIPTNIKTKPFAKIYDSEEDEVLFTFGTVFCIKSVKKLNHIWYVELEIANDEENIQLTKALDHLKDLALSSMTFFERPTDDKSFIYLVGVFLIFIGDYDKGIRYLKEILKEMSADEKLSDAIRSFLAICYKQTGDLSTAENIISEVDRTAMIRTGFDKYGLIFEHLMNAATCSRAEGDTTAIDHYTKLLDVIPKQNNNSDMNVLRLYAYIERSELFKGKGDYIKALASIQNALNYAEQTMPVGSIICAVVYGKISLICSENGNYDTALWFLEKSLTISRTLIPPSSEVFIQIYEELAEIYIKKQDLIKALENYEKVLKLQLERLPNNHPKLGRTYYNIGELLVLEKRYDKALENYEKTVSIFLRCEFPLDKSIIDGQISFAYANIISIYVIQENIPAAMDYCDKLANLSISDSFDGIRRYWINFKKECYPLLLLVRVLDSPLRFQFKEEVEDIALRYLQKRPLLMNESSKTSTQQIHATPLLVLRNK